MSRFAWEVSNTERQNESKFESHIRGGNFQI